MVRSDIDKVIFNSLSFLENNTIRGLLITLLLIYDSALFNSVNAMLSPLLNNLVVVVLMLVVIAVVSVKDPTLAILLAIALVTSQMYANNHLFTKNDKYVEKFHQEDVTHPIGYNANVDCTDVNEEDATPFEKQQCTGVKVFTNEIGAQGLSAPEGYGGDGYSTY